jgi:hypothetical protein
MKILLIGGVVAVGIVAAGWVAIEMLQESGNEPAPVVQTSSDNSSLDSNLDLSETSVKRDVNNSKNQINLESTPGLEGVDAPSILVSLFGNQDQSGTRLHQAINDLLLQGVSVDTSISKVINDAISQDGSGLLSPAALVSTKKHTLTAIGFMTNMVATNDLFTTTVSSIEQKPEATGEIVDLGVVYYPDYAQIVINAAVMTGEMDPNEALLAAIAAGADPSTVSEATAAGANVAQAGLPLAGLGGGGNGNEDLSASNN